MNNTDLSLEKKPEIMWLNTGHRERWQNDSCVQSMMIILKNGFMTRKIYVMLMVGVLDEDNVRSLIRQSLEYAGRKCLIFPISMN